MKLNTSFISNIQDVYGETGLSWLNQLSSDIETLCEKWGLCFQTAMPGLSYHFVALVEIIATGEKAVLKMAPTMQNIGIEAKWLECFDSDVPKIYWIDETYHAYLMEHIVPGNSLKSMVAVDDEEATRIICRVIRGLQSTQKQLLSCKSLSELSKSLPILQGRIDNKLLSQAMTWFDELTTNQTQNVLLHGDLHHDNILSCGSDWKVIDPHGYTGDPAFEVGAMIYNPMDCFPSDRPLSKVIERRFKILAEELPFDKQRIKMSTFCMTLLSISWTVEDRHSVPAFDLEIANIIDKTRI